MNIKKDDFITHYHLWQCLLLLSLLIFSAGMLVLIVNKVPWVDEVYSWYGIRHENHELFWKSINSGVNYSPPLYFYINWILQLFVPLSLNILRVESMLFVIGGTILIFLTVKKKLNVESAFLGTITILLQSSLLFEQSIEARNYGLFFFCSAAVLFCGQSLSSNRTSKNVWLITFISHLALCLTHYLGIIFSVSAAFSRYLTIKNFRFRDIWTSPEIPSWVFVIPLYFFLISNQSSHLNTWSKANDLKDLISLYLQSFQPLFIVIILLFSIFLCVPIKKSLILRDFKLSNYNFTIICSIFWVSLPLVFWFISHLSFLNLFKDRYFIPKEAAWMVLLSYFFGIIPIQHSKFKKRLYLISFSFLLCTLFFTLSAKRQLFALEPSRNYYNWLLLDEEVENLDVPKVFAGDHFYFPNNYLSPCEEKILLLENQSMRDIYSRFSNLIRTTCPSKVQEFKSYLMISDKDEFESAHLKIEKRQTINDYSPFFAFHVNKSFE